MILGFADFEAAILETTGFGRRSTAITKNGTYSMEFDGDIGLETWHNCVSREADNTDPFTAYPGWKWWALGGWLYIDEPPTGGKISMVLSETPGADFAKWGIWMELFGGDTRLVMAYNKVQKGTAYTISLDTWHWVVWVLNRHENIELWVDGSKVIDVAEGAFTMGDNPLPVYTEKERDAKEPPVSSSWFWDTMFLQDDFGFENADTPLTLNADGLRVPVLTEAGGDKGGCGTGVREWTPDITLAGGEYLRAVALKEDAVGSGFQFEACDGSTNWDKGYDTGKGGDFVERGAILDRRPDGARWTEANFNELGWGPRITAVYPLIATVPEGVMDTSPPTRYKGLYPG